jgi:hypothetical protein
VSVDVTSGGGASPQFRFDRSFDFGPLHETGHVKAIALELRVSTSEAEDKLKRLVEVAERGCHIRALLQSDLPVSLNVLRALIRE